MMTVPYVAKLQRIVISRINYKIPIAIYMSKPYYKYLWIKKKKKTVHFRIKSKMINTIIVTGARENQYFGVMYGTHYKQGKTIIKQLWTIKQ